MSAGIHKLDFSSSDDVRTPEKTKVETITIGNIKVARLTAQPGWVWKECIAPVVGTDSCQAHHLGVVQSGSLLVQHVDGSEETNTNGDVGPTNIHGLAPCELLNKATRTARTGKQVRGSVRTGWVW